MQGLWLVKEDNVRERVRVHRRHLHVKFETVTGTKPDKDQISAFIPKFVKPPHVTVIMPDHIFSRPLTRALWPYQHIYWVNHPWTSTYQTVTQQLSPAPGPLCGARGAGPSNRGQGGPQLLGLSQTQWAGPKILKWYLLLLVTAVPDSVLWCSQRLTSRAEWHWWLWAQIRIALPHRQRPGAATLSLTLAPNLCPAILSSQTKGEK